WERRLYALTLGDSGREIDQAIAWYEELADYSLAPEVDLRLAVLRGEAGQLDALRRAVSEWETRGEPLSSYAAVLAAVYLDADEVDPEDVGAALETLGPGWFADALALRLSVRFDEPGLGEAARRSMRRSCTCRWCCSPGARWWCRAAPGSLTRSGFARVRVAGSRCCWRRRR